MGNSDLRGLREGRITGDVIRRFYRVYDRLGFGFAESVYTNALGIELQAAGISFEREKALNVWYKGECVGVFRADLLIASKVIVEVKATHVLAEAHRGQLHNYLRCSNLEVGLLLHFGPKASFERMIHTNDRKRDVGPIEQKE